MKLSIFALPLFAGMIVAAPVADTNSLAVRTEAQSSALEHLSDALSGNQGEHPDLEKLGEEFKNAFGPLTGQQLSRRQGGNFDWKTLLAGIFSMFGGKDPAINLGSLFQGIMNIIGKVGGR